MNLLRSSDMLYATGTRLEEIGEIGYTEGIRVGLLGAHDTAARV